MTKQNTKTDAQITWEKEMVIATEIMGRDVLEGNADPREEHSSFLGYVKLKKSFHDQAEDMAKWITREQSKSYGLVKDFAYFMDRGYTIGKPDRYEYRKAVFNDLAEAIKNGSEYNIYDIVRRWDMFFHS